MALGVVIATSIVQQRNRARRRLAALQEFRRWLDSPKARAFGLGPDDCEIVGEREPGPREVQYGYSLTLHLRTSNGTYFLYISQNGNPFVKIMPPEIARIVLKDRWRG